MTALLIVFFALLFAAAALGFWLGRLSRPSLSEAVFNLLGREIVKGISTGIKGADDDKR